MSKTKLGFFVLIFAFAFLYESKSYTLSASIVAEFAKLFEIKNNMVELRSIGNIFILKSPFKSLLDVFDVIESLEIASEPSALLFISLKGLPSHYKTNLNPYMNTRHYNK